ncbi:NUDIX hydrolase [Actinophytocola sediminis]
MKNRYHTVVDVYVLLQRADGAVLLMERANTGYADGQLCPPSGHLEADENVLDGAIREAKEEVGVNIEHTDLQFTHVIHYRTPENQARIGFFFTTTRWNGEPTNQEPDKCAGLLWAHPTDLPANTVPYTALALTHITEEKPFSIGGW